MKNLLKDISAIRSLAKIKFLLNLIFFPFIIVLISKHLSLSHSLYVFLIVFAVICEIVNLFLSVSLIINISSIYISSKNNAEETVYQIRKYETTALTCAFLEIFFGLLFDLIIWVISNMKIRFLEEKIKEEKEEAEVEYIKK